MENKKLVVPEQTILGHATEITQAGVGSVPFIGGLAAGVLNSVFPSELEKRRAIWEKEVTIALNQMDVKNLATDQAFLSILIQATEAARRTHKIEQIRRLGNTIKNYNLIEEYDLKQKFLIWLDEFTDYEFVLIDAIVSNPNSEVNETLDKVFGDNKEMQRIVTENLGAVNYLFRYKKLQKSPKISALVLTETGALFWEYCS